MDNKKQTPLNWAKRHNKKDVIELLQAHLAATKHKEGDKKPEKIKPKKEPENEVFIDKSSGPIEPAETIKKIEELNEAVRKRKRYLTMKISRNLYLERNMKLKFHIN